MALSPFFARDSSSAGSAESIAFTRSNSPALIASMNAGASAIARLYLRGGCRVLAMAAALVVAEAQRAAAQAPPGDRPPLGSHVTAAPLADLPSSADLFSLLDAAVPEVIADRIDTGGLSTGDPARTGAHGSSWTQTLFRIDDASITDPVGSGTPLLLPRVDAWERVDVMTGLMPINVDAAGLAVVLTPRRPAERWLRVLDLAGTIPGLNAGAADAFPVPIARLHACAGAADGTAARRTGARAVEPRHREFERLVDRRTPANAGRGRIVPPAVHGWSGCRRRCGARAPRVQRNGWRDARRHSRARLAVHGAGVGITVDEHDRFSVRERAHRDPLAGGVRRRGAAPAHGRNRDRIRGAADRSIVRAPLRDRAARTRSHRRRRRRRARIDLRGVVHPRRRRRSGRIAG